uniref:Riboflavin biosynthesis protein PYRR, chloroplastic-like n=1 Tax=Crassostrea virginica TaxID=6565 RepID=A0A8B8CIJ7_CRAVI|nr:riboflavin biosynthesis protein PYRR, chloroplastic-like [Crassostrea virginica]
MASCFGAKPESEDDEIQDLPDDRDKYEYFWKARSPFSQWHPSKFVVDGKTYNCAEQYMMYHKALVMKNDELAEVIMALDNPQEIKDVGRSIPDIDAELWNHKSFEVVEAGNMAKFSQNEELKQKLFNTYPRTLVEASPHDTIWGIGLGQRDKRAWNKMSWRGENRLGEILTRVRDKLMGSFLEPANPDEIENPDEPINQSEKGNPVESTNQSKTKDSDGPVDQNEIANQDKLVVNGSEIENPDKTVVNGNDEDNPDEPAVYQRKTEIPDEPVNRFEKAYPDEPGNRSETENPDESVNGSETENMKKETIV